PARLALFLRPTVPVLRAPIVFPPEAALARLRAPLVLSPGVLAMDRGLLGACLPFPMPVRFFPRPPAAAASFPPRWLAFLRPPGPRPLARPARPKRPPKPPARVIPAPFRIVRRVPRVWVVRRRLPAATTM